MKVKCISDNELLQEYFQKDEIIELRSNFYVEDTILVKARFEFNKVTGMMEKISPAFIAKKGSFKDVSFIKEDGTEYDGNLLIRLFGPTNGIVSKYFEKVKL